MESMLTQTYIQFYQTNLKIIKYYFNFFLALIESFFNIKLNTLLKKLFATSAGIQISSEKFCIISSSDTIFIFSNFQFCFNFYPEKSFKKIRYPY